MLEEHLMFNSHKGKLTEAAASRELKVVVAAGSSRLTAVELKRATGISKSHVGRLLVGEVGIIRIQETESAIGARVKWRPRRSKGQQQNSCEM